MTGDGTTAVAEADAGANVSGAPTRAAADTETGICSLAGTTTGGEVDDEAIAVAGAGVETAS